MTLPTLTPLGFTTEALINNLYSDLGLDNVFDDIGASYSNELNQFIIDAEQFIIYRLGRFYEPADMANNSWVVSKATHIAAYFASMRRGSEHYFQRLFEIAERELDAIATGEIDPSLDIPLRKDTYPSMSNLIIDDWYGIGKQRVQHFISTGATYPNQHITDGHFWGWL